MNSFLSNQINPKAGVPQGSVLSSLLFLIYVNDLPTPHHKQNSLSQFADDTAQWAFSLNVKFAANLLQQDLLKLATWCAKWRIKLNPKKTKVIIFSRSLLARKAELNLTLYGEPLKIYPQVKFLGIIFDSKLTFQKHFEDVLERCNQRYHRLRLLANKKWGPSPATLIQIYKQCVRPIFWIRLTFDYHRLGQHHQQNSAAPKSIYSTCPAFTKIYHPMAAAWLHWPPLCEGSSSHLCNQVPR